MAPPDITRLIVRTSMGDRAAFDQLYRHTGAKLFGVCLRVLNDRGEAEEALQEVFVKIWTKADRFAVSVSGNLLRYPELSAAVSDALNRNAANLGKTKLEPALEQLRPGLDGLLLTGAYSNIEPHHYGNEASYAGNLHDPSRDATTLGIVPLAIEGSVGVMASERRLTEWPPPPPQPERRASAAIPHEKRPARRLRGCAC